MGWGAVFRQMQAASSRAEREACRQRRALEKRYRNYARMAEADRAAYEVEVYENQIEIMVTVHQDCGVVWDWNSIQSAPTPPVPAQEDLHEQRARRLLARFAPTLKDRLLGRTEMKRSEMFEAVENARRLDKQDHIRALEAYETVKVDWQNARKFAAKVAKGDLDAYDEAIRETNPFSELTQLGSAVKLSITNPAVVRAELNVNAEKVIPKAVKTQLKSGKLQVKPMPKGRFYDIYQAYTCSCVLRIARELFALLPIKMTVVNAFGRILNSQTGHFEEKPILSVGIPRDAFKQLSWETVDPADVISKLVHRMCFKKSKSLAAIKPIGLADLRHL